MRTTVCGLLLALSVTVNVPVLVPLLLGSKKTAMEQVAPSATLFPQELSAAKSLEGAAVTLPREMLPLPAGLLNVTVWGKPEVPTYWPGKVTLLGDKEGGGCGP